MAIVFPGLSPEEEGDAVVRTQQSESEKPRTSGDRVFIVGATWFDQWCRHTRLRFDHAQGKLVRVEDESSPDPGPIDNSDILDGDADAGDLTAEELAATAPLKPGLQPKTHYWTLHEPTYKLLKDRHKTTGLEVQRQYIATGPRKRPEVHVDQWHLKVVDDHSGRSMVLPALCMASAEALKEAACGALGLQESEYVIMSYPGETGTPISVSKGGHVNPHPKILNV